jgi:ABC-type sugar transport system permease subunit
MTGNRRLGLSLRQRQMLTGFMFTTPFLVGFVFLFLYPLIQSVVFSLNKLEITATGYELTYVGIKNYKDALFVNPDFVRNLTGTVKTVLTDVPAVLIFSFFAASLLNQEFRGRVFARLMFFLPVILGSGIMAAIKEDNIIQYVLSAPTMEANVLSRPVAAFFGSLRLPPEFIQYVSALVSNVPDIVNASGIPILVFLAGLQSIPSQTYEAARIDGANSWETFWMVTFPIVSPLIVTNLVYVIVDSFTSPANQMVKLVLDTAWGGMGYGIGTAMAWLYFIAVAAILAIAISAISRHVYYEQ